MQRAGQASARDMPLARPPPQGCVALRAPVPGTQRGDPSRTRDRARHRVGPVRARPCPAGREAAPGWDRKIIEQEPVMDMQIVETETADRTAQLSQAARIAPISLQIWDAKYRLKAPDGTPIDLTIEDSWRRVARALAAAEREPAALGGGVLRGAARIPVPASRPHPVRRRHRPARDAVQLLRHGRHRRRSRQHLRASARGRADHAAGRRHRLRLLDRCGRRARR